MPEGPELHLTSRFVNRVCQGRIFSGKVDKSEVHKSCDIPFSAPSYTIRAESRGKEMRLCLCEISENGKIKVNKDVQGNMMKILFRFGMSGKFEFTSMKDVHKHSHMRFYTKDKSPMVLSYVDVRRFGRWEITDDWSKGRGPDPMWDYSAFRSNIVNNLQNAAFDRPICEAMLNQKFFNGIGNYLRAEILFRLSIPPFEKARAVLEGLPEVPPDVKPKVKGQGSDNGVKKNVDLLHLCHDVPLEVVNLGAGGYDPEGNKSDYNSFNMWLQCYYQDGMKNTVDHNGRTIWFHGPAGPMAPKEMKTRNSPKKAKKKSSTSEEENKEISPSKKKKVATKKNVDLDSSINKETLKRRPRNARKVPPNEPKALPKAKKSTIVRKGNGSHKDKTKDAGETLRRSKRVTQKSS